MFRNSRWLMPLSWRIYLKLYCEYELWQWFELIVASNFKHQIIISVHLYGEAHIKGATTPHERSVDLLLQRTVMASISLQGISFIDNTCR